METIQEDICANKHRGDQESKEANKTVDKERGLLMVVDCTRESGSFGRTLDDMSMILGKPPNAISGRVTEAKRRGLLRWNGNRRPTRTGCLAKVYTVTERQGEMEI